MSIKLDRCINIKDIRRLASRTLPGPIFDFLEGGAEDEWTVQKNLNGFEQYPLLPRTLVDVTNIDTKTRLLGRDIAWPVVVAPTGISELFHYSGEMAVARASAESGIFYALSTMSSQTLEHIATLENAPRIFQLYVFRDRKLIQALTDRCRAAGYDALCLTVDTPLSGNRERDRANGMSIPPKWTLKSFLQFAIKPQWSLNALFRCRYELANFSDLLRSTPELSSVAPVEFVNKQFDRSVTWEDAAWLAKQWSGPFVIKGILCADDARRAVDIGATAIWLSNHGGRQLDGVPATIDCIAEVRRAVGDNMEIILDGGIRRGTHIVKALAAGANACAIGRAPLYGLAAGGYAGVVHTLRILRSELERDMALLGTPSIKDIGPHLLKRDLK